MASRARPIPNACIALTACLSGVLLASVPTAAQTERPKRPVATYSIVARDASTGELGVAVQSHWFSVGAVAF